MRVTIDTTHDSHENIKKAIKMLQSIVGEESITNSPEILQSQEPSSPMMDIFGETQQETSTEIPQTAETPAPAQTEEIDSGVGSEELFDDLFKDSAPAKKDETKKTPGGVIEFY